MVQSSFQLPVTAFRLIYGGPSLLSEAEMSSRSLALDYVQALRPVTSQINLSCSLTSRVVRLALAKTRVSPRLALEHK